MLIGNYNVLSKTPGRFLGGSTVADARSNFIISGAAVNRFTAFAAFSSVPVGYVPPYSWLLPMRGGGMAVSNNIYGSGDVDAANLAGGLNADAALTGTGDIVGAALALVVSAVAALSGSGALTADILGKLEAAATLAGDGDITAALGALAGLASALTGSGALTSDIIAKAFMEADIIVTGDALSSANVGSAVWGALSSANNAAGTMGEKLNDAGSASNPWTEVIESGYTAEEVLRILLAVAAGKTTVTDLGGGLATVAFRDISDTKDRISASMTDSERTSVAIDGT